MCQALVNRNQAYFKYIKSVTFKEKDTEFSFW